MTETWDETIANMHKNNRRLARKDFFDKATKAAMFVIVPTMFYAGYSLVKFAGEMEKYKPSHPISMQQSNDFLQHDQKDVRQTCSNEQSSQTASQIV